MSDDDQRPSSPSDDQPSPSWGWGSPTPSGPGQQVPGDRQAPYWDAGHQQWAGSGGYPPTGPHGYMGAPGYFPPMPQQHPNSTVAMVFGLISLVPCLQFLGIPAWILGQKAISAIDATPGRWSGRSEANVGRIIGIITTILFALWLGLMIIGLVADIVDESSYYRT